MCRSLIIVLMAATAYADEAAIRRYAALCNAERPAAIRQAEGGVRAARTNLAKVRKQRSQDKREAIAAAQDELARRERVLEKLRDPFAPFYAVRDVSLVQADFVGRLDWSEAAPVRLVGDSMVVEFTAVGRATRAVAVEEDQVAVEYAKNVSTYYWVEGVPTRGLRVGRGLTYQGVDPQAVFEVTGSRDVTVGRQTMSVPVLSVVDMKPYADYFTQVGDMRTWTDATGKHKFDAIFTGLRQGKVQLVSQDRQTKDVPLSKLSKSDQEYVRGRMKD